MTADSRPDGPFAYYADLYGGGALITDASIRALVDDPATDAATIARLADDLDRDAVVTAGFVEGQVRDFVRHAPATGGEHARTLGTNATYAVGLVTLFAAHVHTFDSAVADLNGRYQAQVLLRRLVDPLADVPSLRAVARGMLGGEYRRAQQQLDEGAEDVATKFRQGPTHANLRALVDEGAIPLTVAGRWPWLHLTDDERRRALLALLASGAVPDPATLPAGSVQSWLRSHPEIAAYLPLFLPLTVPVDQPPTVVADWWRRLGVLGQLAAAARDPGLVGNLDGVQGWGRDLANRTMLDRYLGQIRSTVPYGEDPGLNAEQIASLVAIRDDLAKGNRQLLGLDLFSGERSHAIVAIGNVDTADHVGVFTPGLTSNVPDSLNGYDTDMDHLRRTAQDLITKQGGTSTVATVTYLGYDAPQLNLSLLDLGAFGGQADSVLAPDLAIKGGDSLASFYQGLDASRPDGVHLTALGHSYGSTTTGYALQHSGTGVDDAVLFGSPGTGTGSRDALHVPNLYLIENDNDPVADGGVFGGDPSFLGGVTDLQSHAASHDGTSYQGSTGHTSYLDEGTSSQHNLAAVVAGLDDEQIRGQDLDYGDALHAPGPSGLWGAAKGTGHEIGGAIQHQVDNLVSGLENFGRPPGIG